MLRVLFCYNLYSIHVSILTRPESRMLPFSRHHTHLSQNVSILTRPESRMLHCFLMEKEQPNRFQSSPGPKAGCYVSVQSTISAQQRFQSSPGPKAGCYRGRVTVPIADCWFQSSPGPKAGCYIDRDLTNTDFSAGFNPHPARKPDATRKSARNAPMIRIVSILTRPESRMLPDLLPFNGFVGNVSILTRPESRMLLPG